ncbi:DUF2066 domain-containing protein [Thiolapillus sp.]|uniref:DUF2066 domain-containing protein n=2 Tax=Thiolapillus sp. TaxID=2017437 RepID=UPI0025EA5225
MKKFSALLLFLLVLLLPAAVLPASPGLYSAEVPVTDPSPEARKASIREAFEKVLIKASGYRRLKGRKGMKTLLKHAEDYVQQFRYRNEVSDAGDEPGKRLMWVAFEKSAIKEALQQLGLSVWDKGRPEVLLWLAQEKGGKRALLDPERDVKVVQAVKNAAQQRGLPLLLPIMDLEDQTALRVSDVWTVNRDGVEAASARYGDQLVLLGRLRKSGKQWKAKWTLLLPDRQQDFSSSAGTEEAALGGGIDKVMDWLTVQFVPRSDAGEAGTVMLRFLGVGGLSDYARLMQLLDSLDVISEYAIEESTGDQLLIRAKVRGGKEILTQRLSLENTLAPVASIPDDESLTPDSLELTYQLR